MVRNFDFGDTFARVFRVLFGGFGTWIAISVLFAIPIVLLGIVLNEMGVDMEFYVPSPTEPVDEKVLPADPIELVLPLIVYAFLIQLHAQLTTAGLMAGIYKLLRGETPTVGECMAKASSRMLSICALGFIQSFAVVLGIMCCCVPGVMFAAFWYVTMPALLVEKIGVGAAFGRSQALTHGCRWPVLGIGCLLFIIMTGIGMLVGMFQFIGPEAYFGMYIIHLIATPLIGAVGPGVTYHDLRAAKEGLDEQDLEDVFT
ncbi:MAG: hypothetical protein ACI97A_003526 [Planctomycetota bacterium]|jgi:hypothetical protein